MLFDCYHHILKTMSKQLNHNQVELPGSDGTHNMIDGSHGMTGKHFSPGLQSASVLQGCGFGQGFAFGFGTHVPGKNG